MAVIHGLQTKKGQDNKLMTCVKLRQNG